MDKEHLPRLVGELYRVVGELEAMFPGRHFTPDGHLVGSLGECLAAYHYGLDLLRASSPGVDAVKDGREIEIKATQGKSVGLRSGPEHLLVLKLDREGGFAEIYNGPGKVVWREFEGKPKPSNGQYQISVKRLTQLMEAVSPPPSESGNEDRKRMSRPSSAQKTAFSLPQSTVGASGDPEGPSGWASIKVLRPEVA